MRSVLNIYPNPASDIITVQLPESFRNNYGTVTLYGMVGQVMIREKIHSSFSEINVSALPNGIYFVKYISQGYTETGKFVKKY